MTPNERREWILQEAGKLSVPSEREAFLAGACGPDVELRQRIVERLAGEAGTPPEEARRAGEAGPTITMEDTEAQSTAVEGPGTVLGRYRILEKVGEGGFGAVYVAEQKAPVKRRVALKVVKLGMDTQQVVARFEAERQALAMMDHPNIAKVLDAGATDSGRPYFVMELVRGIPITTYCDQHGLSTQERVALFIQVCQAVQHAHQKGIIHRDLKPSNILVTLHDGVPVPMVIDFGIAKAMHGELTDKTLHTQFQQFLGTPAYMSPEQAEMSALDIDTRADIYSLGVLLYELLTGRVPFETQELLEAGVEELRRILREREPAKPSTRLGKMTAEELTTTAKRRGAEPPKLISVLRGDLDWIVMKCLEKDRTRRFDTASGLAADLRRHLDNEPVTARPPSAAYRLGKAVRRNKLAFAAAGAVGVALGVGIAVSTWQAVRARAAEALARQRLAESEAISAFLSRVFQRPSPFLDGRKITVAETLAAAVKKLETDLASQPAVRARLEATLASTYHSLGISAEAVSLEEKALQYYRTSLGPDHSDTLRAMEQLARGYSYAGRRAEEMKVMEELMALRQKALTVRRETHGPEHHDTLEAMEGLVSDYAYLGRSDDALTLAEELLMLRRKVNGAEHPDTIRAIEKLVPCYSRANRNEQAIALAEEAFTLTRKAFGSEHRDTLWRMHNLAVAYSRAGRHTEVIRLSEQRLTSSRKLFGTEHAETLAAMATLATVYANVGRREDTLRLREESLELHRKVYGPDHPSTISAMEAMVDSYASVGRKEEVLALREAMLGSCRKAFGTEHPMTLSAVDTLASLYVEAGRREQAEKLGEEALSIRRRLHGPDHSHTLAAMTTLARSYAEGGRQDRATEILSEVQALRNAMPAETRGLYPRDASAGAEQVDLSGVHNAGLNEAWHNLSDVGNSLSLLPHGLQTFAEVTFDVRGIVQLSSTNLAPLQPEYPDRVEAIRIGHKAVRLHFLHGTGWAIFDEHEAELDAVIGRYLIAYADGQQAEVPIRYREDLRNWQFWPESEAQETGGAQPAWKGPQERWKANWPKWGVRLYKLTWNNPRPEVEIASLDFVSTMTGAAPFLIAVTIQPPILPEASANE